MEEWIKKMWYTHTVEYYALKNRRKFCHCDNMDEPRLHYAKWNKSDAERQLLYDIAYMW